MCQKRFLNNLQIKEQFKIKVTSKKLQCEMEFHVEANSQTKWKNKLAFTK